MTTSQIILILACGLMLATLAPISYFDGNKTLNIKAKTVGDGQHGSARWATRQEISRAFHHAPFLPQLWRQGEKLPSEQGIVVGCTGRKNRVTARVDTGDVHALMIGAAGVGKTAFFMIPNIEYALASGMSFCCSDTKGGAKRCGTRVVG